MDRITRQKMMRDIPFETVIEHTVDFIELLGTPGLYLDKIATVEIKDWRGALPCDFNQMIQVREKDKNGMFVTYRYSDDSFHLSDNKNPISSYGNFTYTIQGMVMFTSTKNATLEISYRAFATDEDGFPLLPDNVSFLRGLEAYIKLKWFEQKYEEGSLSQNVMDRVDREYCWAVGDAQSEFSRLTLDKAETLFNSFKTLLPRNNEHWKGFFDNGAKEIWKN